MEISKVESFIEYKISDESASRYIVHGFDSEIMQEILNDSMKYKLTDEANIKNRSINKNRSRSNENVNESIENKSIIKSEKNKDIIENQNRVCRVYGKNIVNYIIPKRDILCRHINIKENLDFSDNSNIREVAEVASKLNAIEEQEEAIVIEEPEVTLEQVVANLEINDDYTPASGDELEKIYETVNKYSAMYNIDSNLILAIIKQESNFNSKIVSHAGAMGLMQLMDFNCETYGINDPFDIDQNIHGGVKHLRVYLDMYDGDVEMALMAYNGGPGNMAKRGVDSIADLGKMPLETQSYVPKILDYYRNGFSL